ncbi:MAG: tetratricopeptide repeat protein [Gammaproteobacteria bacterium]|nr:tetratricopeptide repeat protein [Gammaproteobacteria bacterium]
MSLLLDALKKAAEQKAEKSRQEEVPEAHASDETQIVTAAEDASELERSDNSPQQRQRDVQDETELEHSELQTHVESTRPQRDDSDETGIVAPDAADDTRQPGMSAQMQTGEDETIIFAAEDVSDFMGEPELVNRDPQDETQLTQLAPEETQVDQPQTEDRQTEQETELTQREDDTYITRPIQPGDQNRIRAEASSGDETDIGMLKADEDKTDISVPVGRADEIEHAVLVQSVPGEDTHLGQSSEELGRQEPEVDEDLSLLLVEREETHFNTPTSPTDTQTQPDHVQDSSADDELGLVDTTRHQPPSEATVTSVTSPSATATTGIAQNTQTTQGANTRVDSTSTRTYAPDNYDRTLMKLPSDDASKIFAGMKSDSDVVMTPDYAKKVFRSKSSAQRMQHYKIYGGIFVVIMLAIIIFGGFEYSDESESIDTSLRSLKRDPMPGLIRSDTPGKEASLFAETETEVDTRAIKIIENAGNVASGAVIVTETSEPAEVESVEVESVVTESETVASVMVETESASTNQVQAEPEQSSSTQVAIATQAEAAAAEPDSSSSNLQISLSSRVGQKDIWLREAYAAYQSGNDELAMSLYNKVLEVDPGNRNALLARAAINVQNNNSRAAIRDYQTLLEANPKDSLAMTSLISVASISPQDTQSQLKLMLREEPHSPYLNFALANAYGAQNRWQEAQGYYFIALENNPRDPNYAYNLAVSLEHISQPKTAMAYYQRALDNFENGLATFNRDLVDQRMELLAKR